MAAPQEIPRKPRPYLTAIRHLAILAGAPFANWGHTRTWQSDPSWRETLDEKLLEGIWHGIYLPLWRIAWADQDHLRLLQLWEEGLNASRQMTNQHDWQKFKTICPADPEDFWPAASRKLAISFYDRCRLLVSIQEGGVAGRCLFKAVNTEVLRTLTVTAVALQRYQLRHGKFPGSLQALLPEFLPSLPTDEMDGQPLRYKLQADGTFVLYSVGENGVDNGGAAAPPEGTISRNILRGRDIVWPVPATREEITAADDKKTSR